MAAVRETVQVSRRLPLDTPALRVALLFLSLDTLSDSRRWTLGPLGAIEIDPQFVSVDGETAGGARCSIAHGRLCAPDGFTVDIEIRLTTREGADPKLTLRADARFARYREPLTIAARAGLNELAEELRFFGTRQQTVS